MPPRTIGPYSILGTLGSGGIGTVYRARDKRTGDEVALKLLSTGPALDPIAARRMAREFEALHELSHANVVRVFDTGVFRGYPYLAMELIEGLNLKEYLALELPATVASAALPRGPSRSTSEMPLPVFEGIGRRRLADPFEDDDDDVPARGRSFLGDDDEASTSGPRRQAFGVDELGEEPNTDMGLFSPTGEHASGRGPEALRRLADEADEPMTGEYTDESDELEMPFDDSPTVPLTKKGIATPPPDLGAINRPERIGRLKDALLQICEALSYVHARGMVHRDLKPANIMVDEDRRVKLMDFGLAKFLAEDTAVTASGRVVGTYRYMAPEQLMGERVDGRSDLYSVGVMLYEFLTGRPPFDARTPAEMWRMVLEQEPTPLSNLNPVADRELVRLAHRLMRKEPSERYQTAEEVYEAVFGL